MIQRLNTFFATLAGCLAIFLAHQYVTVGFGLNPWVSVPIAMLMFSMAFVNLEASDE